MSRIFIDSAPLIYLLDPNPAWASQVADLLASYPPETELVSSVITLMECQVKPLRDGNQEALARLDSFFREALTHQVSPDERIARRAAELRARHGFLRAMDALQIACATASGCSSFVTNDKKLQQIQEISVLCLADKA